MRDEQILVETRPGTTALTSTNSGHDVQ